MSRKKRSRAQVAPRTRWSPIARRLLWPATVLAAGLAGCASDRQIAWPTPTARKPADPPPTALAAMARLPSRFLPKVQAGKPVQVVSNAEPDSKAPGAITRGGKTGRKDDALARTAVVANPPIPPIDVPSVIPKAPADYPIDLTTSLRLAEVENPDIAAARQGIREALALQQQAYALLLPTFNAGTNYHGHTGNLQRSSGRILSLSEQSIYVGGGARTLAAESLAIPAVNIFSPLADALYQPLVARQNVARARFDAAATANEILLDVATLHFDLVEAEASLALRRLTASESAEVARLTARYAETGQESLADADRGRTIFLLIEREIQRGEEAAAVASARLARRLHLDPSVRIHAVTPAIAPISLVDMNTPVEALIQTAIQRRPDVASRGAGVSAAQTTHRQELARPFLPYVWLGFSGGGFAGGSNLIPPLIGHAGGRTDFDVRVYWTLQNLGIGNLATQRRRRADIGQAMGRQSLAVNEARSQVASALAECRTTFEQIEINRRGLTDAEAGFSEDLERIRGTIGRPIEVTNSLELLADARQIYLRSIIAYNRAQVRLYVALGSPPPLDRPANEPLPPAPIAYPPLPLPGLASSAKPVFPQQMPVPGQPGAGERPATALAAGSRTAPAAPVATSMAPTPSATGAPRRPIARITAPSLPPRDLLAGTEPSAAPARTNVQLPPVQRLPLVDPSSDALILPASTSGASAK